MTKPTSHHRPSRIALAVRSATVWFSAAVPVLLAIAESFKDQLPMLNEFLTGWRMVAASVAVSAVVAYLRVRTYGRDGGGYDDYRDGPGRGRDGRNGRWE